MNSKILKNSSYILVAQVFSKAVAFFYTIFLARSLGVSDFGLYTVALSYFSLISSISDFGISRYLIRELSKGNSHSKNLLSNIIMLRLTSISIIFVIFAFLISIFDPDHLRVTLTLMAVLAVLPQALALTIDGILVANQKISLSSICLFLYNLITPVIGYFLIKEGFGPIGAVSAIILGQVIYLLILLITSKKYISLINFKIFSGTFNKKLLKDIIFGSLPYGVLGVLGLLYFKIDTLLLSYLKGSYDTGIYAASYKFLETLVFIPGALATVVFPVFARLHDVNNAEIRKISIKIVWSMGLLGIGVVIAYLLILPLIIKTFLPNYILSIDVIRILAFSIPFMFIHIPLSQVVLTTDKYLKSIISISVINVTFNVVLNIIFIPKYGYMAAAWITVLSDVLSLGLLLLIMKKHFFSNERF